jgi:Ring finger domain
MEHNRPYIYRYYYDITVYPPSYQERSSPVIYYNGRGVSGTQEMNENQQNEQNWYNSGGADDVTYPTYPNNIPIGQPYSTGNSYNIPIGTGRPSTSGNIPIETNNLYLMNQDFIFSNPEQSLDGINSNVFTSNMTANNTPNNTEANTEANTSNNTETNNSPQNSPVHTHSRHRHPPGFPYPLYQRSNNDIFYIGGNDNIENRNFFDNVEVCITEEDFEYIDIEHTEEMTDKNCSICQVSIKDKTICKKLKCGHTFHIACARKWLCNHSVYCPECRYDCRT